MKEKKSCNFTKKLLTLVQVFFVQEGIPNSVFCVIQ